MLLWFYELIVKNSATKIFTTHLSQALDFFLFLLDYKRYNKIIHTHRLLSDLIRKNKNKIWDWSQTCSSYGKSIFTLSLLFLQANNNTVESVLCFIRKQHNHSLKLPRLFPVHLHPLTYHHLRKSNNPSNIKIAFLFYKKL